MIPEIETRIACLNNLNFYDSKKSSGKYQMPFLRKQLYFPNQLIDFSSALASRNYDSGVHFFIDDYRFERLWKYPAKYIPILSKFAVVLTPDFSVMRNMPRAMQIWNIFRSRLIGYAMQEVGIRIIPSVSWSDESSFDFCFDGIENNGIVAISSVGVIKDYYSRECFINGINTMLRRINPIKILFYGTPLPFDHHGVEIVHFRSNSAWKKHKNM